MNRVKRKACFVFETPKACICFAYQKRGIDEKRPKRDTDQGEGWLQLGDNTVRLYLRSRLRYHPVTFKR